MDITQEDLRLILYNNIYPLQVKMEIYDSNNQIIDVLFGIVSGGNETIDSSANVRRTLSINIIPSLKNNTISISEESLIWINRSVKFYVGILNQRTGEYKYYPQGTFYFTNTSYKYDSTTNELNINCGDYMVALDGSKNGKVGGSLSYIYPAYDELFLATWIEDAKADGVDTTKYIDVFKWAEKNHPNQITTTNNDELKIAVYSLMTKTKLTDADQESYMKIVQDNYDKEVVLRKIEGKRFLISYYIIREVVIKILQQLTKIKNYMIDHIGELNGLPEYNDNYKEYQKEHPLWNKMPYDLEFNGDESVLDFLISIKDLYPNYELFFDENNTLIMRMIPSCYADEILYDNDFIQKVLISEDTTLDMTAVKNICEVWGKGYEVDFYTEECVYKNNCYSLTIGSYEKSYFNGDVIGFKIPDINTSDNVMLRINALESIPMYLEGQQEPLPQNYLKKNLIYVVKIVKTYEDNTEKIKAYLLGQWQAHALDVLTDGTELDETYTDQDGITSKKYSLQYFKSAYNCETVNLTIIPDSPFTVQKIGEILDKKIGNEYDIIDSDSVAMEQAEWDNYKNYNLTDNVTITTRLMPFLEVNKKVSYKKSNVDTEQQFLIKSISHDYDNWTSTITMTRFYPLYKDMLKDIGAYKTLSEYTYGIMSKYSHDELSRFKPGYKY